MKALSQRALVDISFTGKVTGTEKIYFQRKNEFSFKLIPLMVKKFIMRQKMEDAARDRIKSAFIEKINNPINNQNFIFDHIKKCVDKDVFDKAYSEVDNELLNEQKKIITNNESKIEIPKEDRIPNTEQAYLKNEFENEKISEEFIVALTEIMNIHKFSIDLNFLLELNKETNNKAQVVAKDSFTIPLCQKNLANFYEMISSQPDSEYKNLMLLTIDKLLNQLSAPEIQYIPPTIQSTEHKIEKLNTPINKEIVNPVNEKNSKESIELLKDYLIKSTEVSLFGKERKIYSDSEVEMIKKIINTSFQGLNKQINSQDKNQYRKLLLKIKNKVETNPEIQNQQQILNGIHALNKKVNAISVPRSKH
jgi:hypothetical protein